MIKKITIPGFIFLAKPTVFIGSLLFVVTGYAGSDLFIDFEATLGLDDNVTRAAENIDIEHDGFLTLAGTGGYELLEGRSGTLTGKVLLEASKFHRFDGLSNIVAAGKLNYTFALSSGFGAPWFSLDAEYGAVEFESFLRDSNIARATATMGIQIDDATSTRLGFNYQKRDAESQVFDTENTSFFVNLDWEVVKKHIIYATYKVQKGDAFSSASNVSVEIIDASFPNIVDDDVFIGKQTYKLDATIQFVTLGYNWIQDLHSSFDLSARYLESKASDVDLEYEGLVVRLSYFRRFNL